MRARHVSRATQDTPAHRPPWFTQAKATALRNLERRFGGHLVVYIRKTSPDEHGPQLCQLHKLEKKRRLAVVE